MKVSSETILAKMEAELIQAKKATTDRELLLRRVENIKVLCEILLAEAKEEASSVQSSKPTKEEVEWMMGRKGPSESTEDMTHDPKSIFDF